MTPLKANGTGRFVDGLLALGRHPNTVILRELVAGPRRYNELLAATNVVAEPVLGESLRELDADGLIHRRVDPGPPLRVLYELTPRGRDLAPGLGALEEWARTRAT